MATSSSGVPALVSGAEVVDGKEGVEPCLPPASEHGLDSHVRTTPGQLITTRVVTSRWSGVPAHPLSCLPGQ